MCITGYPQPARALRARRDQQRKQRKRDHPMSAICPPGELTLCHWDCGTFFGVPCHQPATWVMTAACVHEHVQTGGICDEHKTRLVADLDPLNPWCCRRCADHDCVAHLTWREAVPA